MKTTRKTTTPARPRSPVPAAWLDVVIVLAVLALFWPLTRFFFAQDDFVLIEKATRGLGEAAGSFFASVPGQFRPLTKGLYFVFAHAAFGMNAVPYHVLSILLHAANAMLLASVLRRAGVAAGTARLSAALFAFGMMNMEAVAWASCVQQLAGGMFALAAIRAGMDAAEHGGARARAGAALAYALALLSYEQTLAVPIVLCLWVATRRGARAAAGAVRGPLAPVGALFVAYLVFTLGWKGIPAAGPYAMTVGANVLENLRAYASMTYAPWMIYPVYGVPEGLTGSHAAWVVIVALLVARRRFGALALGTGSFLLLLAPVLFTTGHVHSFHLYVPAVGAWYLAACAMEEVMGWLPARVLRARGALLVAAAAACFVGSTVALHRNTTETNPDGAPLLRSFVLRRAVQAERMWHCLRAKADRRNESGRLVLIYRYPQYRANWLNIHAALGQGSGVRLALDRPDLDVIFAPPAEIPPGIDPHTEALYYTELGECRTVEEMGIR